MSSSHHKDGALFIHLRYRNGVPPDECQWALYLHQTDERGGILYQIKTTETGRIADHWFVRDVFHDSGELRALGHVPFWKFEHADGLIRCLDNGLDYVKEKTSMKWVLMMVVNLMEEKVIKKQSIKKLKQEMIDWVNRQRSPADSKADGDSGKEVKSIAEDHAGMRVDGMVGQADGHTGPDYVCKAQGDILGKTEGE